jgi:hypothetical protein
LAELAAMPELPTSSGRGECTENTRSRLAVAPLAKRARSALA